MGTLAVLSFLSLASNSNQATVVLFFSSEKDGKKSSSKAKKFAVYLKLGCKICFSLCDG